ncbi:MAG: hypothetical protein COA67_12540 [Lutibacter sp.]|nr:MAG: hypothetical protein COA67_12540 [Lutibacter sp.]
MKNTFKLISFFVLVMLMGSCSSDKNSLTKVYVLEYLKQREVERPLVFKNRMNPFFITSKEELNNAKEYYLKLYKEGYVKAVLRTDIPNPETSFRPYKVVLTEKAAPFILEKKERGVVYVRTIEFNAVDIKEIRILSDFKAEVDVVYKKTKTSFHNSKGRDISKSGKEYPEDTYIKTIDFIKNQTTNEWKHPIKVMF